MTERRRATAGILTTLLAVAGCASDAPVERSFRDDVELHLGRELSPSEVVEFKETAELLCDIELDVLKEIWSDLDTDQFVFQTFVFTKECPEREPAYRQARIRGGATTVGPTTTRQ